MLLEMTIEVARRMAVVAGIDPVEGHMVVLPALSDAAGVPRVGAVGALVDSVAGVHAFSELPEALPLTADLTVHALGVAVEPGSRAVAASRLLKRRRTSAVFEVDVRHDRPGGELLAVGTVTYTFLDGQRGRYTPEPLATPWPPLDPCTSLDDLLELSTSPEGHLEVPIDEVTCNAVGVLGGAATVLLADEAAARAAAPRFDGPVATTDLVVHFLAPGKVGPAQVRADVVAVHDGSASVRTSIVDRGNDDRLVAVATATVHPAAPAPAPVAAAGEGSAP